METHRNSSKPGPEVTYPGGFAEEGTEDSSMKERTVVGGGHSVKTWGQTFLLRLNLQKNCPSNHRTVLDPRTVKARIHASCGLGMPPTTAWDKLQRLPATAFPKSHFSNLTAEHHLHNRCWDLEAHLLPRQTTLGLWEQAGENTAHKHAEREEKVSWVSSYYKTASSEKGDLGGVS